MLLLGVAIALGVYAYRQNATIETQQAQLLAASERTKTASLDLQAKCSEQASKAFAQAGYTARDAGAAYQNHYNRKLNKCFIEIENTTATSGVVWTHRTLFDAFESKPYGTYAWRTDEKKKYWEVAPVMCEVISPNGEKQPCGSDDEFQNLIRIYMEGE